jgi:hypothetical protein
VSNTNAVPAARRNATLRPIGHNRAAMAQIAADKVSISFSEPASRQLLFDGRSAMWHNSPRRKWASSSPSP